MKDVLSNDKSYIAKAEDFWKRLESLERKVDDSLKWRSQLEVDRILSEHRIVHIAVDADKREKKY